jgi:hypothetical protein
VVYPAFEKKLGDEGKRMADDDRAQHQKLTQQVKEYNSKHSSFFIFLLKIF